MNETRAHTIADRLRQAIREGVYLCGERLIELNIAREFGVSQNTVRDALWHLEQEGWLIRQARHGVTVRAFSTDEAEEVYALWALLAQTAFSWAAEKWTRVDLLNQLRPPLTQARLRWSEGQWSASREAIWEFHRTLSQLSGRSQTAVLLSRLCNQAWLLQLDYEFNHPRSVEEREAWIEGYEQLLGVIKFADSANAAHALHERILEDGKPVIRWLAMHT
ncbi:MAG: GntR family transcriptional regulator [Anaerolineae bacterium]|jgi:DNA-binding GntR family transcriptional regulator|nr:GntR family transcriptional regulator [Anaerolineae bacterium]